MAKNTYIQNEIDKVIQEQNFQFPLNMAMAASWVIANFKGINIKVFDVTHTSSLADYYILGSVTNPMQSRAIVDELTANFKRHECSIISTEGLESGDWVLIDMGDIIVHLFMDTMREVFDLDTLWAKYEQVAIPPEYYMNTQDAISQNDDGTSGYF